MKKIRKFLSEFFLTLVILIYFALSCAIPGLNKDPLTEVPDSWNGRYARDTNLSVAVLEIKEGKIFYISNEWTITEIFPENCGMEDGTVYYHNEMCQKISGDNIVGYKRNADSNIEYFNNSSKIMYVKIGDSSTTTTTTVLAVTTTVSGVATTSTTIPQLSYNNSLTATSAEIERGAIINYAAGYIQFVIPRTLAEEAYALDTSVKILKHHGEYIDVWNWNTARPGITPYIDGYYKIVGSNVYATNQIPLSVFTSNTTGAIFDAWDNPTKYDFGVSICGINGVQLPETINGGYIYNWIAKLSANTTQWAIQTSNFEGSIYVVNANFDISLLYSAGTTTTTYPVGTTSTSAVYVTSTTYLPTSTTVSGASTTTSYASTSTTLSPVYLGYSLYDEFNDTALNSTNWNIVEQTGSLSATLDQGIFTFKLDRETDGPNEGYVETTDNVNGIYAKLRLNDYNFSGLLSDKFCTLSVRFSIYNNLFIRSEYFYSATGSQTILCEVADVSSGFVLVHNQNFPVVNEYDYIGIEVDETNNIQFILNGEVVSSYNSGLSLYNNLKGRIDLEYGNMESGNYVEGFIDEVWVKRANTTATTEPGASTTTSFDSTTSTVYVATTTTTIISNFSTAVDNQNISFITNEGINWIVDETSYYYGNSSIKNGDIDDNSSSYIETTISGVEQISFYWKVSSELNYDYLNFYIDDNLITSISGSVDWTQVSYDLDSGIHIIKWSYSKDGSVSNGDDCGWVDNVVLTISGATTTSYEEVTTTSYEEVTTTTTTVTPFVADPVITYDATNDLVTITSDTPSATIYYTENGGTPSESDYLYEGAFYPTENSVIRAVAYRTDYIPSNVVVKAITPKRIYIKCVDYIIPAIVIAGCSDSTITDDNYVLSPVSGQPSWYYYEFEGIPKNTALTFTDLHIWDNFEGEFHNFSIPNNPPAEDAWYSPDVDISYSKPIGAPEPVGGATVHALKPASWTNIYLYSWGGIDLTNDNGGWPGELMSEDSVTDWYNDTLVDDQNIIFNNGNGGGSQTIDIAITPEVEIWVKSLIIEWTSVQPY